MLPLALRRIARAAPDTGGSRKCPNLRCGVSAKYPANPAYRRLLAETFVQQRQFDKAEAEILVAKRLAPNDPITRLNLAQIYSAEKKWSDAQKEFEVALELDPHGTTTLGQYADFLVARNQSARAMAIVQHYVSTNANDGNGHQILGGLYLGEKNYSAAQTEFERAIRA